MKRSILSAMALLIGIMVIACAPSASPPATAPGGPQTTAAPKVEPIAPPKVAVTPTAPKAPDKVSLRLDWLAGFGYHAAFYYGIDQGLYREQGIDLEIKEGQGSTQVYQVVAAGTDTFGFGDAVALPKAVKNGVPVVMVAGLVQQTPFGILMLDKSNIASPKDLQGKTLAITPGGAGETILPALLKQYGIDSNAITYVNVPAASKNTIVLDEKVDGAVTTAELVLPRTESGPAGKKLRALSFSKSGVNTLSFGIVASRQTVQSKPDLVQRFVTATQKSWDAAKKNPGAAIEAQKKAVPSLPAEVARKELQVVLDAMHTKNSEGKPTGWMAEADWQETVKILTEYGDLGSPPALSELYSNQFIGQ